MDRQMLINAVFPEEIRIAILEGTNLHELEIESVVGKKAKGNIYKAKISRIEPSLQAAFVDLGTNRNGFLQINDVHPSHFINRGRGRGQNGRVRIQDVLEPGQDLVVQVVKEERELKGATLTTFLSLPGRYVVLMPGSERGGISRKIMDAEQRTRLKRLSRELELPDGIGLIVRTAGLDRSLSELSRDLSLQLKLWERIVEQAQTASSPALLYKESDLVTRVIRDYFTPEIREIWIDDPETFRRVKEFVGQVMPRYRSRVRMYEQPLPIYTHYGLDKQIEDTMTREVKLRAGGAIVIDSLEALVAIDVNSGKATAGDTIEETAYKTNLEAADEVARQLRLRDLGGLIVIDFIDMTDKRHKAAVERRLQDAVGADKARIEIGRISKFGLLEMSRQRLRASLSSQSHLTCDHCRGTARVKNPDVVSLEVLRKIQGAVVVGHVTRVKARVAPAPALFLLNNKKRELTELEQKFGVQILILPDGKLRAEEYEFEMDSPKGRQVVAAATPPPPLPKSQEDPEDEDDDEIEQSRGIRGSDDDKEDDSDEGEGDSPDDSPHDPSGETSDEGSEARRPKRRRPPRHNRRLRGGHRPPRDGSPEGSAAPANGDSAENCDAGPDEARGQPGPVTSEPLAVSSSEPVEARSPRRKVVTTES